MHTVHRFFKKENLKNNLTNLQTGEILFNKYLDKLPKKEKMTIKKLITVENFLDTLENYFNPKFNCHTKNTTQRLYTVLI
jgi:hypothetical protein